MKQGFAFLTAACLMLSGCAAQRQIEASAQTLPKTEDTVSLGTANAAPAFVSNRPITQIETPETGDTEENGSTQQGGIETKSHGQPIPHKPPVRPIRIEEMPEPQMDSSEGQESEPLEASAEKQASAPQESQAKEQTSAPREDTAKNQGTVPQSPSAEEETPAPQEAPDESTAPTAANAAAFIGRSVQSLYAAIGMPLSASYAPSCLHETGEDGELIYDGFTVYTYRDADTEIVVDVL